MAAYAWKGDPTSCFRSVTTELSAKPDDEADQRVVSVAAGRGIDWQQLTSMELIQLLRFPLMR